MLDVPYTRDGKEQVLRMIHVRNPHRTNEWFGRFHDDDWESWNAYPEALKATGHKAGYKQGFSDIAVNFSAELGGKRYSDTSPEAHRVHEAVEFGALARLDSKLKQYQLLRKYIKRAQWQQCIALVQRMQINQTTPDSCFVRQRPDLDKFTLSLLDSTRFFASSGDAARAELQLSTISFNAAIAACDKGMGLAVHSA
eukprot:Skav212265  [mRNA]  locus=scaffold732:87121:97466:- [translate_table: standard]